MTWQMRIPSVPTRNATARMRVWPALKASPAAVLRDGVYALPDGEHHRRTLTAVAAHVREHGGMARQLHADDDQLLLTAAAVFEGLLVAFEKGLAA
jgi:hypothetical protein